jgi:ABC-type proline/glycine betaine transport system permease subunit
MRAFAWAAPGFMPVAVTPLGLVTVGGLVAAVLLSVPPIIRAAARARQEAG